MKTLVTVIGARPQFIKASVVSDCLRRAGRIREVLVHTGQHFDDAMSEVFFRELAMERPAYNLGVCGGSHGEMTGRMLQQIEPLLMEEKPDAVLVYGDTNSTLAGALAAAKLHIPVAHVEAGLRSFNRRMPEEINRVLTDHLAQWLYAPTREAVTNLGREGIDPAGIVQTGDVMYDVAIRHGERATVSDGVTGSLGLSQGDFMLATIHRAENTDDPDRLGLIVKALLDIARDVTVVWPMHPRTRARIEHHGIALPETPSLRVTGPVGYLDMVRLEKNAAAIITDSGGIQKEAFFHRVPCVTVREETEWVELVEAGWNRLAPPKDVDCLVSAARAAVGSRGDDIAPYGSGEAAIRIVQHLEAELGA